MSYTTDQIREKYQLYQDENYSGYFDDAEMTRIAQKAVLDVVQKKIDLFQNTQRISEDLAPLTKTVNLNSSSTPPIQAGNFFDLTNATLNYKAVASMLVRFTGTTIFKPCQPLQYSEQGSYFSEGSTRYPNYRRANDNMYIDPTTVSIAEITLTYFVNPNVTDGTQIDFNILSYDITYPEKMVEEIIEEMMNITSINQREDLMYRMSEQERTQNG